MVRGRGEGNVHLPGASAIDVITVLFTRFSLSLFPVCHQMVHLLIIPFLFLLLAPGQTRHCSVVQNGIIVKCDPSCKSQLLSTVQKAYFLYNVTCMHSIDSSY